MPRVRSWRRGHAIHRSSEGRWRWSVTGRYLKLGSSVRDPPCVLCHMRPTALGHDPCVGTISGAESVCCGHGVTPAHVKFPGMARIELPGIFSPSVMHRREFLECIHDAVAVAVMHRVSSPPRAVDAGGVVREAAKKDCSKVCSVGCASQ